MALHQFGASAFAQARTRFPSDTWTFGTVLEQWAGSLTGGRPKRNVMPRVKNNSRNQGSRSDVQVEPEASVSKRKSSGTKVSLPQPIHRDIGKIASAFCKKHGLMDRATAERIARMVRASITPRRSPGRPPTPEVLKAVELRQRYTPWPKIFPVAIPEYWNLLYEEQYCRRDKLRRAVGAYFRRRRTKRRKRRREKDSSPVHTRSDTA